MKVYVLTTISNQDGSSSVYGVYRKTKSARQHVDRLEDAKTRGKWDKVSDNTRLYYGNAFTYLVEQFEVE